MALLVIGVLLFTGIHLIPSLAPGVKAVAGFEHHDDDENRKSFGGVFVVTASF